MDVSDVSQTEMEMDQGEEGEGGEPAEAVGGEDGDSDVSGDAAVCAAAGAGEVQEQGATAPPAGAAPSPAAAAGPEDAPAPAPPARLLITKMEMENFKSYGGLREIGPFHKCFSSIVGPNGSGKSNVIDAMLFVFGKKAKKLRLNKLGELIHRSDSYPNLDFCRVSVHFVDILDVSGSEDDYEEVRVLVKMRTRMMMRMASEIHLAAASQHSSHDGALDDHKWLLVALPSYPL